MFFPQWHDISSDGLESTNAFGQTVVCLHAFPLLQNSLKDLMVLIAEYICLIIQQAGLRMFMYVIFICSDAFVLKFLTMFHTQAYPWSQAPYVLFVSGYTF